MEAVISYITSIFVTVSVIFSLIPNIFGAVKTYSPEESGVILNCAVVSDTHADNNSFRDRTNILRNTYAGIGENTEKIDVLLNIGDITNSGSVREYLNERRLEAVYIRPEHSVACMGNHDSWNGSADPHYDVAAKLFLIHLKKNGIESDKVYYSTVIDGYHFICLATESLDLHENLPTYSEEQLNWLDNELTKAEKSGLPVFVLSHKPLAGRNGATTSVAAAGIDEILQSHSSENAPILFFSGHYHTFGPSNYESENNVYYLNLPSTEYNDETVGECNDNGGMGLTMEVYESKIIINSRNFIKDKNIDGYRLEIDF